MKKHLLLLFAVIALSTASRAQFQYFYHWSYMTPTYSLSNGIATTYTPGFTYFGYQPALSPGLYGWSYSAQNFIIHNVAASIQWMSYKVYESDFATCTGTLSQVMNGVGVTGMESFGFGNTRFAVVGAYDNGCYFVSVAANGFPQTSRLYRFPTPASANTPAPTKPYLVQDPSSGDYFIMGGYNNEVYVLRVDFNGNVIWSNYYKTEGTLHPKDIILSPYDDNRVIVVGCVDGMGASRDGFFLDIEANTGIALQMKNFGSPVYNDDFRSIIAAAGISPANDKGFVIAGSTDENGSDTHPWVLKLDVSGNIIWSNQLDPLSGNNEGFADILERQNTFNAYEYYGVLKSSAGMVVLKLDDMGLPFPITPTVVSNEFVFNLASASGAPAIPSSISKVSGPMGNVQVGIQVYGTSPNLTVVKTVCMFAAYYNGENCARTLLVQKPKELGPVTVGVLPISQHGSMNACTNFTVLPVYQGYAINYPCSGLIPLGNNERPGAITGVNENQDSKSVFSTFPNPVTQTLKVKYAVEENAEVFFQIRNTLGQEIASVRSHAEASGNFITEFDLSQFSLESGVYFISAEINGQKREQKFIYSK